MTTQTAKEKHWWGSNSGRVELQMTYAQASQAHHSGQCDSDVMALSEQPDIKAQLDKLDPDDVRAELQGYGAWDEEELQSHSDNLQRILWLACGDIVEEVFMEGKA